MRRLLPVVWLVGLAACDPTIKSFDVSPAHLACPGSVTVTWSGDANGARIQADHAVSPPLPATLLKQGSLVEHVSETTQFTFFYPSAAHREKTVDVTSTTCQTACGVRVLAFTGTCAMSSGPTYVTRSLTGAEAPGQLVQLLTDADFPIHVQHAGADIALGAGGGPIGALPAVPAAGGYAITVPGQVGLQVCSGAGPTRGSVPAPPIHLSVTPTCPVK
jgi:hypothetical protein